MQDGGDVVGWSGVDRVRGEVVGESGGAEDYRGRETACHGLHEDVEGGEEEGEEGADVGGHMRDRGPFGEGVEGRSICSLEGVVRSLKSRRGEFAGGVRGGCP